MSRLLRFFAANTFLLALASLLFIAGSVQAATVLFPSGGGLGSSVAPTLGKIPVGTSGGVYAPTSTISGPITVTGISTLATTTTSVLNGTIVVDGTHYAQTSAGINKAISFCGAFGIGNVYLPAGTYTINSRITPVSNCHVYGAGKGITILQGSVNSDWDFNYSSATVTIVNFALTDLTIDLKNGANAAGVQFSNSSSTEVSRVEFKNGAAGGWFLLWASSAANTVVVNNNNKAIDDDFTNHAGTLEAMLVANSENMQIVRPVLTNISSPGIGLWQADYDTNISDFYCSNSTNGQIYYNITVERTVIDSPKFNNCGGGILGAGTSDNGNFGLSQAQGLKILSPTMLGGTNTIGANALELGAVNDAIVTNPLISNYGAAGIAIDRGDENASSSPTNWSISGGTIKNNNQSNVASPLHPGIYISTSTPSGLNENGLIQNVKIYDDQASPTQKYPITFDSEAGAITYDGITINNNELNAPAPLSGTSIGLFNGSTLGTSVLIYANQNYTGTNPGQTSLGGQWTTNGTSIYYSGGRVGVGTSSPDSGVSIENYSGLSLLHVGDTQNNSVNKLLVENGWTAAGTYGLMVQRNSSTPQFTVDGTGFSGFGTSTPASRLSVNGNSLLHGALVQDTTDASSFVGALTTSGRFGVATTSPDSGASFLNYSGRAVVHIGDSQNTSNTRLLVENGWTGNDNYSILVQRNQGGTPQFVVTGAGNVGVGTSTPGSIFSVNGIANFASAVSTFYSALVGKLWDKGGQVYNVAAYGAKCDGTTNDSAAINLATSSMPSQGATLAFPAGVCLVSYPVQPPQQSVVEGSYLGSTVKLANGSNSAVFAIKGNHIVMQDLFIDGNSSNQTSGDGIQIIASFQPMFDKVYLANIHDTGFKLIGTFGINSLVHIIDSTVKTSGEGINVDSNSQDTVIDNFYAEDITGNGITNNGNGTSMVDPHIYHANLGISDTGEFRTKISSPVIEHMKQQGMLFTNSTNPQITDARVFDNALSATGTVSAIEFAGTTNGGIISTSVIYDDNATQQYGIKLGASTSNNIVSGDNQISGVASSSIKDLGTNNFTVNTVNGNMGIGTSTPYSKLEIWGANTTSGAYSFLIANFASSTVFAVDNAGNTYTKATASTTNLTVSGIPNCNTTSALTTNTSGVVACGSIGVGSAFPFTPSTFGAMASNATSTLTGFTAGLYSLGSSTIGGGTPTTGLTIMGGATTTGNSLISGTLNVTGQTNLASTIASTQSGNQFTFQSGGAGLQSTNGNINFFTAFTGKTFSLLNSASKATFFVNLDDGKTGIGTSSPATTLVAQGPAQFVIASGVATSTCTTAIEGSQVYNLGNHHLWLCMGSEPWTLLK